MDSTDHEVEMIQRTGHTMTKVEQKLTRLEELLSSINSNLGKTNPNHEAIITGLSRCEAELAQAYLRFSGMKSNLTRYRNVRERNLADAVAEVRAKETSNKNRFNLRWSYELSQTNQEK